jgi:hypothetical protein
MGYFVLEFVLFLLGLGALVFGQVPVTKKRKATGSAAHLVGVILMVPLLIYLLACNQTNTPPLSLDARSLDALRPHTEGFVKLVAVAGALACMLVAAVLAIITSEPPRRP